MPGPFFTLEVITRLAYGEPFGHIDEATDMYGWIEQADMALKIMGVTLDVPAVRNIFSRVFIELFGPKPTDKWGIGKVIGYVLQTRLACIPGTLCLIRLLPELQSYIEERLRSDMKPKRGMMVRLIPGQCELKSSVTTTS